MIAGLTLPNGLLLPKRRWTARWRAGWKL